MVTNDVFEKLRVLQGILAQKNTLEKEILEAPRSLTGDEEALKRFKTDFIEYNSQYEDIRSKIASVKNELSETEAKKENSEQAMDNIKTQREYEALDKEIQESEKKCVELRKELQRLEKAFKQSDDKIKETEAIIEESEKGIEQRKAALDGEIRSKKAELENLKTEEAKLSPGLSEETMFKFERIIKSKNGLGIVPVRSGVCAGCHMILPSQFINEVRESKEIRYCPYCSRILFYEETGINGADNGVVFDDSDMGGLADLI